MEELENKTQESSVEQNDNSREGYQPSAEGYQGEYRSTPRPQRPRIHAQRTYSSNRGSSVENEEGGFRPEGFGAGLQNAGSQHPRGGYQPRPQQGGYRP
ncbi:MAG: pseudouridine synthase, partial [Prevotella sp.]